VKLIAFVKRDCPTCVLVVPALEQLAKSADLSVWAQDDPAFFAGLAARDDTSLEQSWRAKIEAVPTLVRVEDGREVGRALGWHRGEWEALAGVTGLAPELPAERPGCGSLSVDPERELELRVRFEGELLRARRVELADAEDEHEALFARGWTDGLPVVPPTEARVLAMLSGTKRAPDEIVAIVPPDLAPCSVEKVAINAVMAGCKPEYLPVVIAALEAACTDTFNIHGVLATTMGVGPIVVVNGPIRRALGMNSGINALGQGNRANSTIGRALQLVIRNVGGGRPGEVDRATYGNPGKVGLAFAEDEEGSPWAPLATDFGVERGRNAVTVFAGEGPRTVVDQLSREPESLARSLAAGLRAVHHPKLMLAFDAMLVIGPEHARVFREAGWTKAQLVARLTELSSAPGAELMRGAGGIAEGLPLPPAMAETRVPKFRPGALHVVHAGGGAGLFSVIIGGWVRGAEGSQIVCREVGA
jgi:thiol-disulfide isomerase/thioredoxin